MGFLVFFLCAVAALFAVGATAQVSPGPPLEGDVPSLWPCGGGPRQTWLIESGPFPYSHLTLADTFNATVNAFLVLDISGWSNNTGPTLHAWYNSTGRSGYNQQWSYGADGSIRSKMNGLCVTSAGAVGLPIEMDNCSSPLSASQTWAYNATTGAISQAGGCFDIGSIANCSVAPYNTYTYCDPSAETEARVEDFVSRLTPIDFQNLLSNSNSGVPRLGLPPVQFAECLHGTLSGCGAPYTNATTGYTSSGCPTSFPHLLTLGSTLNRSLWAAIGAAVSDEDRGLHNQHVTGSLFWCVQPRRATLPGICWR